MYEHNFYRFLLDCLLLNIKPVPVNFDENYVQRTLPLTITLNIAANNLCSSFALGLVYLESHRTFYNSKID